MTYKQLKSMLDEIVARARDNFEDPNNLSICVSDLASLIATVNESYAVKYYEKLQLEHQKEEEFLQHKQGQINEGESISKADFWAKILVAKKDFEVRKADATYRTYQRLYDSCEKQFEAMRSRLSVIKKEQEKYG